MRSNACCELLLSRRARCRCSPWLPQGLLHCTHERLHTARAPTGDQRCICGDGRYHPGAHLCAVLEQASVVLRVLQHSRPWLPTCSCVVCTERISKSTAPSVLCRLPWCVCLPQPGRRQPVGGALLPRRANHTRQGGCAGVSSSKACLKPAAFDAKVGACVCYLLCGEHAAARDATGLQGVPALARLGIRRPSLCEPLTWHAGCLAFRPCSPCWWTVRLAPPRCMRWPRCGGRRSSHR